jgi:hypothetical protein
VGVALVTVSALLLAAPPATARQDTGRPDTGRSDTGRSASGGSAPAALVERARGLAAGASGCDAEIDNRNGTTTYVDTTAPDAVAASWTPAYLRVVPRGTPTTRLLVRFVETCSGVADATAVIRNVTTNARYAVDLDLFTFDVRPAMSSGSST